MREDMREGEIERRLSTGVRALGGTTYKFVSPGNSGVPDRIVIFPGGLVEFVEVKAEGGRLRYAQMMQLTKLKDLGCRISVLCGMQDVCDYLSKREAELRGKTQRSVCR